MSNTAENTKGSLNLRRPLSNTANVPEQGSSSAGLAHQIAQHSYGNDIKLWRYSA